VLAEVIGVWSAGKLIRRDRMSKVRRARPAHAHPVFVKSKVTGLEQVAKIGALGEPSWNT
jgi:hypothetical protein